MNKLSSFGAIFFFFPNVTVSSGRTGGVTPKMQPQSFSVLLVQPLKLHNYQIVCVPVIASSSSVFFFFKLSKFSYEKFCWTVARQNVTCHNEKTFIQTLPWLTLNISHSLVQFPLKLHSTVVLCIVISLYLEIQDLFTWADCATTSLWFYIYCANFHFWRGWRL